MKQSRTKKELDSLGVIPKKSRGQNFLNDSAALAQIISFATIQSKDSVLEIGGGLGSLTAQLAQCTENFITVEVQQQLAAELGKRFGERVLCADIRSIVLPHVFPSAEKIVVLGNVPYSISTEIILWIIAQRRFISRAVLLLQQEFAERLAASPGSRAYGSLSVLRTLYATARLGPIFSGELFVPTTKVSSRLVELTIRGDTLVPVDEPEHLEQVVKLAFSKRRKTLLNAISPSRFFPDRNDTLRLLSTLGIAPERRAETLQVEEFVRLAEAARRHK